MPKKTQLSVTGRRKALFNENDNVILYRILLFQILLLWLEFKITLYFILFVTVLFSESGEKNDDDLFSFLSLTLNIIISTPFLTASRIHYNNISLLKLMMMPKSLYEKMICSEHFKWVYISSWIKEESGIFDTSVHTHTQIDLLLTF